MTTNIDVQLGVQPDAGYVLVSADTVPGVGQLSWPLTPDNFAELRDQLNEAWLNMQGLESRCVRWEDAVAGDIIPSVGAKLLDVPHVLPSSDLLRGYFLNGGSMDLPRHLELAVHRRIE